MPKGGASGQRHATDAEWKIALRLRLDELGWTNLELARRLGVTPGAITHLFKKSVTSTLRPKIEKLVGWPDSEAAQSPPSRIAVGSRRPRAEADRVPAVAPSRMDIDSGQLADLISHFQALDAEDRARLVERAHTLREGAERKK